MLDSRGVFFSFSFLSFDAISGCSLTIFFTIFFLFILKLWWFLTNDFNGFNFFPFASLSHEWFQMIFAFWCKTNFFFYINQIGNGFIQDV